MEGLSIATDVPCVGCSYNLRMLPVAAACPECSLPVKQSLDQTILKWGPQRLWRIALGMRLLAATALAIPLILAAGILLIIWISSRRGNSVPAGGLTLAAMTLAGLVHAVGAWMATTAPRGDRHVLSRWICRVSALLIPLVLFGLTIGFVLQIRETLGMYLLDLAMSALIAGWALYAERAAACWTDFHRRGGFAGKAGLGKWSMRCFATVAFMLAGCMCTEFASEAMQQLDIYRLSFKTQENILAVMRVLMLASLATAAIVLVLITIALLCGANRAAKLARLAQQAERGGFTAPLAPTKTLSE